MTLAPWLTAQRMPRDHRRVRAVPRASAICTGITFDTPGTAGLADAGATPDDADAVGGGGGDAGHMCAVTAFADVVGAIDVTDRAPRRDQQAGLAPLLVVSSRRPESRIAIVGRS